MKMHRFVMLAVLAVALVPQFTSAHTDIDGLGAHPGLKVDRTRRMLHWRRCEMPPYPAHGWYTTNGIPRRPGDQVWDRLLTYSCDRGYILVGGQLVRCKHGEWINDFPECVDTSMQSQPEIPVNSSPSDVRPVNEDTEDNTGYCKLVPSPNIEYRCVLTGDSEGTRKCQEYEPPGMQVTHKCAVNYRSDDRNVGYMVCRDGDWVNKPRCLPECGGVTPEGVQLIITGRSAKTGELPWHVGIYSKKFNATAGTVSYSQICGGTLISTTMVISAAHCFWSDTHPLPATNYAVAAGKLYRQWRDPRDDAQHSDVKELYLPDLFMGVRNQFQADIAMLVLAQRIQYAPHVHPVCLSFEPDLANDQLRQGNLGKVAGWGLTSANGGASPQLKVVELPYVDPGMCKYKSAEQFKPFITADKFCAGYENGTALCRGDSGGGLVFKKRGTQRYYLRGIVSTAHQTGDKCNSKSLTTFTDIMTQIKFINQHWHADE